MSDIDPIHDELESDGRGFDAVFDLIKFESLKANTGEVTKVIVKDYSGLELGAAEVDS